MRRDYSSIVSSYSDRECKQSRTKTIKSLGYVEYLMREFEDPISHFKEVVALMNDEIRAENSKFSISLDKNALLSEGSGIRKSLGYSALSLIYHKPSLDSFFSNNSRSFKAEYSVNEIMRLLKFS